MADLALYKRSARLLVQVGPSVAVDASGLDFRFSVVKDLKPEPNTAEVTVWNLSRDHRSALEQLGAATVLLEAGYEGGTQALFLGDMRSATSVREGPDYLTTLTAGDGERAVRSARVSATVPKGARSADVLRLAAAALGVGRGNLDDAVAKLSGSGAASAFQLGTVLSGSAAREMSSVCRALDLTWSIEQGKLQLLPLRQALRGTALRVGPRTGLVGSPTVDKDAVVSFRTLLIPELVPGRLVVVESERVSGAYRVEECTYLGETRGGDWYVDCKGKRY